MWTPVTNGSSLTIGKLVESKLQHLLTLETITAPPLVRATGALVATGSALVYG
jgi:hypothetical protein